MTQFIAQERPPSDAGYIVIVVFCKPENTDILMPGQERYIVGSLCPKYEDWLNTRIKLLNAGWEIETKS